MKVYDSYANVIGAIDCYDDGVLLEAREFALALCAGLAASGDSLQDELNAHFEDDCRAIGVWDDEEEICTNDVRVAAVFGREEMNAAVDRWSFDEDKTEAVLLTILGMLRRSASYEKMYC